MILCFLSGFLYGSDGSLDQTFGVDGLALSAYGPFVQEQANAVVIRYDGVIVTGGYITSQGKTGLRFVSFDQAGRVLHASTYFVTASSFDYITGLAVQPDNKVVAVGYSQQDTHTVFIVARYNLDGTLDTTFNAQGSTPGIVSVDFFNVALARAYAVTLTYTGHIIAVGEAQESSMSELFYAVALLNPDGTLDNTFAQGMGRSVYGTDVIPQNNMSSARAVAIQHLIHGDAIVLAGFGQETLVHQFQVVRLTMDGNLDTTFGQNLDGVEQIDFVLGATEQASGVAVYPDGSIVAAGTSFIADNEYAIVSTRLLSNGNVDMSYNGTGKAQLGSVGTLLNGNALIVQNDAKIVIGGAYNDDMQQGFFMVRYLNNGSLDASFGVGGQVRTTFNALALESSTAQASAIGLQSDGKIVLAGGASLDSNPLETALARYNNNNINNQVIVDPVIIVPTDLTNDNVQRLILSGVAQNPSNITLYIDNSAVDDLITVGSTNTWSAIIDQLPAGRHMAYIVAGYKSGNQNSISNTICYGRCLGDQSCLSMAIRGKFCPCIQAIG